MIKRRVWANTHPGDIFRVSAGKALFVSELHTGQTKNVFGRRALLLVVSVVGIDVTLLTQGTLCHLTEAELYYTEKLTANVQGT